MLLGAIDVDVLSISIKCQQYGIPCALEISKPVKLEEISKEILGCAERWAKRKLRRKCYKLKNLWV